MPCSEKERGVFKGKIKSSSPLFLPLKRQWRLPPGERDFGLLWDRLGARHILQGWWLVCVSQRTMEQKETATSNYHRSESHCGWEHAGFFFFFFFFLGPHHRHSNARSKPHLWPTLKLTAMPDPSTHWARPGTEPASIMDTSRVLNRWATTGAPGESYLFLTSFLFSKMR